MIKLVCNMLHAFGAIRFNSGVIKWSLIEALHNLQDNLGLRLANKLSSRNKNFQQSKMKVS